jgi:hypothetical protein
VTLDFSWKFQAFVGDHKYVRTATCLEWHILMQKPNNYFRCLQNIKISFNCKTRKIRNQKAHDPEERAFNPKPRIEEKECRMIVNITNQANLQSINISTYLHIQLFYENQFQFHILTFNKMKYANAQFGLFQ